MRTGLRQAPYTSYIMRDIIDCVKALNFNVISAGKYIYLDYIFTGIYYGYELFWCDVFAKLSPNSGSVVFISEAESIS